MDSDQRKTIRFRGRTESVLETFRVRGRTYFAVQKLSSRGAFRVFDSHAGPDGGFRTLYQFSRSKISRQQLEILRRLSGSNTNRNFPGIVDFVTQGEHLFVVVAWVDGTDLKSYLDAVRSHQTPRPSVPEVVRLVRGLVHGLSHYHRRNSLIHGDVSPANIVLSSGTKQLVLIDFGSAWPQEHAAKREPDELTFPYAAPERLSKHAVVDFRSDVFSLSSIAYELLTLSVPYDGLGGQAGLPELIGKVDNTYRPPSELISKSKRLPQQSIRLLDQCIGTGLQLHPDRRFATSREWLDTWDSLHFCFKKGGRLSRFEELVVTAIDSLSRIFGGPRDK